MLMLDSDNGVINPQRNIEDFIFKDKDLVFYKRIFNNEVAAGSYIAK